MSPYISRQTDPKKRLQFGETDSGRQFHMHESRVFPNVRIPILKFQHTPSNLPCDMSAQNQ
jgi:hypothetical protein